MTTRFFALLLALAVPLAVAQYSLTIEAEDVVGKEMRVTYSFPVTQAGLTAYGQGYFFNTGPLTVIRVFERNTQQDLPYRIGVSEEMAQEFNLSPQASGGGTYDLVGFEFPNPIPEGGSYTVEISVTAQTDDISRDADGRWSFSFNTAYNDVFFVLPPGHAIVYASEPVLVYERAGSTVVQVKRGSGSGRGSARQVIFKTRADF